MSGGRVLASVADGAGTLGAGGGPGPVMTRSPGTRSMPGARSAWDVCSGLGREGEGTPVKGSSSDFEAFVAARGPRLLRAAWLLTGDAHLAEDLVQTVLAKLWPKWHRIADGNPEAYARKALVNTFSSWWQRRWRAEVPHHEVPASAPAGADAYAGIDLHHSLAAAVRALPTR